MPLYYKDILREYDDVFHRDRFHFKEETIQRIINPVKQYGIERVFLFGSFAKGTATTESDIDNIIPRGQAYKRL